MRKTLTPPPCLHQCLMTRRSTFCMQNALSGQTLFLFLSTKTSNLLPQYSTPPNVCIVMPIFLAVVLIDLRYIVLFHHDADKDATDYFRGIVKTGEKSLRVLQLTETIIRLNPAHYSAWYAPFRPHLHRLFFLPRSGKAIPLRNPNRHLSPSRARARPHQCAH